MAAITISSPSGGINPTNLRLPFNRGGVFADSLLKQSTPDVITINNPDGEENGLFINNATNQYNFGDYYGYQAGNAIILDSIGNTYLYQNNLEIYIIQSDGEIKIFNDNITSATAGGSSGQHLKLTINGTKYKLALLNS